MCLLFLIDSDFLLAFTRIADILLVLLFIGHLLLRFKRKKSNPFFLPWVLVWIWIILNSAFGYFLSIKLSYLTALIVALFILLSSEFIPSIKEQETSNKIRKTSIIWVKWGAIFLFISALFLIVSPDSCLVILNYTSFISLALYTGKYYQAFPKTKQWIIVILYTYAGLRLHLLTIIYSPEIFLVTVVQSLYVPLKILLYYSGYMVLFRNEDLNNTSIVKDDTGKIHQQIEAEQIVKSLPPEPTVQIQFTGFWGFLYILWRYPSGKILVMFMFVTLVTAISFLFSNISALIALLHK